MPRRHGRRSRLGPCMHCAAQTGMAIPRGRACARRPPPAVTVIAARLLHSTPLFVVFESAWPPARSFHWISLAAPRAPARLVASAPLPQRESLCHYLVLQRASERSVRRITRAQDVLACSQHSPTGQDACRNQLQRHRRRVRLSLRLAITTLRGARSALHDIPAAGFASSRARARQRLRQS